MGRYTIPDRWLDYSNVGRPIEGSPLIAFKTPLMEKFNIKLRESERFTPENLVKIIPNIGLIIDLTATNRYYNPSDLIPSIKHIKLITEGHVLPQERSVKRFTQVISDFLRDDKNASLLVGVHCTHGVNRTGYMICRYLMDCMKVPAEDAIKRFAEARGHSIERKNYTNHLRSLSSRETHEKNDNGSREGSWRQDGRSYRETSALRRDFRAPVIEPYARYSDRRFTTNYRDEYNCRRRDDPERPRYRESDTRREYRRPESDWRSSSRNLSWRNPNFDSRATRHNERSSFHRTSRYPEQSHRDGYRDSRR